MKKETWRYPEEQGMTNAQRAHLIATDVGLLSEWALSALMALHVLPAPDTWLYAGYHDPAIVAWNWSFLPLDLLLSLVGLSAVGTHARGCAEGQRLAQISLALTFCAGFMAISFWAIRGDFDPAWWAVNLYLAIWPVPYLARGVSQAPC